MSRRPIQTTAVKSPARESPSDVDEFLIRELAPENVRRASNFSNAVRVAGERYVRYSERKEEWFNYSSRREKLKKITTFVDKVASGLGELDIVSRDDLASRVGSKEIDGLIGSLRRLGKEMTILVSQVQPSGRARDLDKERWIIDIAEIYEKAFDLPASIWGAEGGPIKGRRSFYRFLELSHPCQFDGTAMSCTPGKSIELLKRRRSAVGSRSTHRPLRT